jgi:hypothetical protein
MPPKEKGVDPRADVGVGDGLERQYYDSLSELEQRVCEIARDHLKSSFDFTRSSGFLAWKKNTS